MGTRVRKCKKMTSKSGGRRRGVERLLEYTAVLRGPIEITRGVEGRRAFARFQQVDARINVSFFRPDTAVCSRSHLCLLPELPLPRPPRCLPPTVAPEPPSRIRSFQASSAASYHTVLTFQPATASTRIVFGATCCS